MCQLQEYLTLISPIYKLALTDVDIVSKMAHWRLLNILPTIFCCDISEIATIPSLKYRASRACTNPDKLFRDADTAKYAFEFMQKIGELPAPDADTVSALQRHKKIDPGEAVLIAIAYKVEDALLATGDKNAIQSLHTVYATGEYTNLQGRVVCLEQLLKCCLDHLGLADLQEKVKPALDLDKAIKNIFGGRCDAPLESVQNGLNSYIDNLRASSGELLM